jgi:hypothetical protein
MSFDHALRLTEILLAFALLQQSSEHLVSGKQERRIFLLRLCFGILLFCGWQAPWVCLALLLLGIVMLHRFAGPYNGGSDRMGLLILCCLTLALFLPQRRLQEVAFGYLAAQAVLSYFIAGAVKLVNPEWLSGRALQDVFRFSAYPVSESLRRFADHPLLLRVMSWAVILLEVCFPFALLSHTALILMLVLAAAFHFANACLFGLNRFFWVWLAAYPSLLWLQDRITGNWL